MSATTLPTVEHPESSGTPLHAWIRDELRYRLRQYLKNCPIGIAFNTTDCRTSENSTRCPDISFFAAGRLQLIQRDAVPIPFPPDIAVEVLSPSENAMQVNRKVVEYLAGGSSEVWVIDTNIREIHIRTSAGIRVLGASDALETTLLPGFSVKVADILAGF